MAARIQQADSTFTESRVYGIDENTILAALPQVLAKVTNGAPIETPLPGCFTAQLDGMPARAIIVRVEPESEGTRVRLDIRPWQDQRLVWLGVLLAVLVVPIFVYLIYAAVRSIVARPKGSLPPEVLAHGVFRGLSDALSTQGGSGYRVAAAKEVVPRDGEDEDDDAADAAQARSR